MNIAVDFGGTNIKIGLVEKGAIISKTSISAQSDTGLVKRLPVVKATIHELLAQSGYTISECSGIGMATPGLVDTDNQTILSINDKYADAIGFSFFEWVSGAFSLPLVLENDARAALIGETAYGVAQGETNAVLMTFGTGIGTAAIINDQILRGRHYQAGILGGHFTTNINGPSCNCGNIGCLEAQSGSWALEHQARQHVDFMGSRLAHASEINYLTIVEAARAGDRTSIDLLEDLISNWSAGIVNLIHAYDPDVVILSGGLMKSKKIIVPLLEERVHRLAWTPWGKVRFMVADDPDTSVLLGVSRLLERKR
ncbi:ROK family protein [Paenibacillus cremeus]|uniref:ROK family protein n=1 Tax=Paenibacillus cremeus TaxID=2163881 RepID=A0A559K781_9BACL|nr:ROK family protein [Paenibacillus cremeus]TVY07990.1 ROK family protein [Paenibacillus cremeus]